MENCIFCKIIERQVPSAIIAESDDVIVIKDIAPKAPIHYLIIPKKHIKDIQSFERADCCSGSKMILMAQQLSKGLPGNGDFRFIVNSGPKAGQRVFHVHAHFIAGIEMTD